MSTIVRRPTLLAFAWLLCAIAAPGWAATTCVATASNISFGSLAVSSITGAAAVGSLYEGCSGGWTTAGNLTVCNAIGTGANSVSQTARTMTNGAYQIPYQLYSNSSYTTLYAYPGSDTFYIAYSTKSGGYTTVSAYAKILSSSSGLAPGTYTDTYTSSAQGWADFDTWNTTYPPITCGQNVNYAGATIAFTISVTVLPSCSIVATNLSFPSASVLTSNVDATTNLSVTCTATTPYNIGISAGAGAGATTSSRSMTGSGASIGYALYQNASRSINWGDNPPPATNPDTVSGTGTGTAQSLSVYARVPPQTTPRQGTYSDTVIVTVYY